MKFNLAIKTRGGWLDKNAGDYDQDHGLKNQYQSMLLFPNAPNLYSDLARGMRRERMVKIADQDVFTNITARRSRMKQTVSLYTHRGVKDPRYLYSIRRKKCILPSLQSLIY